MALAAHVVTPARPPRHPPCRHRRASHRISSSRRGLSRRPPRSRKKCPKGIVTFQLKSDPHGFDTLVPENKREALEHLEMVRPRHPRAVRGGGEEGPGRERPSRGSGGCDAAAWRQEAAPCPRPPRRAAAVRTRRTRILKFSQRILSLGGVRLTANGCGGRRPAPMAKLSPRRDADAGTGICSGARSSADATWLTF